MKVLVFGHGWLGKKFKELLAGDITDTRIENVERVRQDIEKIKPDVVVNTAGKPSAKDNIDWCLDHIGETMISNIVGPTVLAKACQDLNVPLLVLLSSGCIFDGPGNVTFSETSCPNPVNFYGWTRVVSEAVVREIYKDNLGKLLIPRFRMPLDKEPHYRNLITKLIKYSGYVPIVNAPNSVTVVDDLLMSVKTLIERNRSGIYHVVSPKPVRHIDILRWCYESGLFEEMPQPELLTPEEFNNRKLTKDKRSNCVLDDTKLRLTERIILRESDEAIKECILAYKRGLQKVR